MQEQPPGDPAGVPPPPPPAAPPAASGGLPGRAWRFALREAGGAARTTEAWLRAAGGRLRGAGAERLRATALVHPGRLLGPLRTARRLRPDDRFLAEAELLLTARARGWTAALPLAATLPAPAGETGRAAALLLRNPGPGAALEIAPPAPARPSFLPAEAAAAIVIYTAVIGRAQALPPVFGVEGRIRCLCFTDQPLAVPGWEMLPPSAAAPAGSAAEVFAFHKIRPEAVLAGPAPDCTAALWLDPDQWLDGNPDTLLARWLLPQTLAFWRHPAPDWRDMAETRLLDGTAPAAAVLTQAAQFAGEAVPGNAGGLATGMIWRRHAAPESAALAAAWWQSWRAAPGADDLALYRALHGPGGDALPRPQVLPARLGSATDNVFTAHAPRQPPRRLGTRPAGARLPVVFVSAASHARSASTLLRGRQLSAMIEAAFPDYEVGFTEDAGAVQGAVVVLTKGALATQSPEALAGLARRNITAIGCWDDIRPDPEKARVVDAHMTLSHRQTLELNQLYPGTPAFLVTHHVNPEVPRATPPADRLRTGYFGDIDNTVRPASLAGMVELVGIDTRNVDEGSSWLQRLPDYNCHWIVRRARPWDGWKPFLKGFVAARCGAVVVTTADDGDAAHYLGDDYPFYARSLAPEDLEMAMAELAAGFGGLDWQRARDIMTQVAARSTDAQVCTEFRLMVETLTR
jgi:hypothetical protein